MNNLNRYEPDLKVGLTNEQVRIRYEEGLVNYSDTPKTKTIKEIIRDNFLTYFNFLNLGLGISIFVASVLNGDLLNGFKNSLFMGVIIINSIISIIEEIISKKIIDKLSLINETSIKTMRDGIEEEKKLEELVLDDVIKLSSGKQIVCDSIILEGNVEVNESLLTGEPDAILKKAGDMLLSGSFVISGSCYAKVEHIGSDNYTSKISREAKYQKQVNSVIMKSFEDLLKIISYLIIPLGIVMYFSQLGATNGNITEAIYTTVAALIGMIPEGLVLLTSSVMAVSVIRLSKYKVLVQQLYCIETLARVDVICLDKTGTLTTGKMNVVDIIPIESMKENDILKVLKGFINNTEDYNMTMEAIKDRCSNIESNLKKIESISFSSERKYQAMSFDDSYSYYLGAPEYLLNKSEIEKIKNIQELQSKYRVLVLLKTKENLTKKPKKFTNCALIVIEDIIRKEAKETLDYFTKQGVSVKIISGDNEKTVANIARNVGLENIKSIDTENLSDEELKVAALNYNLFARVKPYQKQIIVEALQNNGRCVAMTGDGVNDVLALKKSDCAISVASGSDAARNVAQLVLLDNNFASLPKVVAEGRRTINNIERSSSLLLVKTIYTILLIIFSIIVGSKYFFVPIQLTLITDLTIGIPSFILALEPNKDLVKGNFLLKIASKSTPAALTVFFNVFLITLFSHAFSLSYELMSTLSVYLTAITGFIFLYKISKPFSRLRLTLFLFLLITFIYLVSYEYKFFNLVGYSFQTLLIAFVLILDSLYIFKILYELSIKLFRKLDPTIN